jgi:hypothetical protein
MAANLAKVFRQVHGDLHYHDNLHASSHNLAIPPQNKPLLTVNATLINVFVRRRLLHFGADA